MKKCLIVADLEGIYGVKDLSDTDSNKKYLMEQLQITCKCVFDFDENYKIHICLIHDDGSLLAGADFCDNRISYSGGFFSLLTDYLDFDFAIMIGFHSKAGGKGRFPHSFRNEISCIISNDREVGEVFLYSMLLKNKGIEVIFVSGEGNFEDEVLNCNAIVHEIVSMREYEYKLMQSLSRKIEQKSSYYNGSVSVFFFSTELREYLTGKYSVKNAALIFESVEKFFECLISLATDINDYYILEKRENLLFVKKISSLKLKRKNLYELEPYLCKDVMKFTKSDREKVFNIIHKNYENIQMLQ